MSENTYNDLLLRIAAQSGFSVEVVHQYIQAFFAADPEFWAQAAQKVLDAARDLPPLTQFQTGGYVRSARVRPYSRRYQWGGPKDER